MIKASAILYDGVIYTGFRHDDIISYLNKLGMLKPYPDQGFIDETGRYLTRDQAMDYAYENGQIGVDENGNFDTICGTLTSEDLW